MLEENNPTQEPQEEETLNFESKTKGILKEIAKWSKVVGIVGFVFCAFLLLAGVALTFLGDEIGEKLAAMGQPAGTINPATGIIYAVIAVLYYFASKHIYDFSVYLQQGVQHNDQESVDYSFDRLRAFFKLIGMLAIIVIGFYAFAFVLAMLTSLFSGVA